MRDYIQGKQEEKRRKKAYKIHLIVLSIVAILSVSGIIWFLHSNIYTVSDVLVGDTVDPVLRPEVTQLTWDYIHDRSFISSLLFNTQSLWGFSPHSLSQKISEAYPILTDISVSKNYITRVVTITARERKKVALWCDASTACWWFDDEGILFLEGPLTQGQLLNKVTSQASSTISLGDTIPIEGGVATVNAIFSFLDSVGDPVKNIIWNKDLDEIQTDPRASFPVIYFSIQQHPQYALNELKKYDMKSLAYIDLTINNRIYLCKRGAECDRK